MHTLPYLRFPNCFIFSSRLRLLHIPFLCLGVYPYIFLQCFVVQCARVYTHTYASVGTSSTRRELSRQARLCLNAPHNITRDVGLGCRAEATNHQPLSFQFLTIVK